ncbi:hypothetical protein ANN_16211 [Periplaneta americana]|uniref:Acylphosphatase n=1 Tax=Periplaneta americana TaxID=6978 RepID=A0ABQ8SIT2_PERAM|nr:hypothetical protein ANN_16211 [Periplaneta americana]
MSTTKTTLISEEFEVYGKVQGVFFRKFTVQQGQKLGLRGWCMNTNRGTVSGVLEGDAEMVEAMKQWLQNVGSPQSKIERAEFRNQRVINAFTFKDFSVRHQ